MISKFKNKSGFTLIELLVVLIIFGVLATRVSVFVGNNSSKGSLLYAETKIIDSIQNMKQNVLNKKSLGGSIVLDMDSPEILTVTELDNVDRISNDAIEVSLQDRSFLNWWLENLEYALTDATPFVEDDLLTISIDVNWDITIQNSSNIPVEFTNIYLNNWSGWSVLKYRLISWTWTLINLNN